MAEKTQPLQARDLVSVLIPAYNCEKYITDCLHSLKEQSNRIFVFNDASLDDTEKKVRDFGGIFFVNSRKNRGANAVRNKLLQVELTVSNSPYIFIADADCIYYKDLLNKMVRYLEDNEDVDFVYCNYDREYDDGHTDKHIAKPFDISELFVFNYISMCSLVRKSAIKLFDENIEFLQDWDYWLTLVEEGHKGHWLNETLFKAYVPDSGKTMKLRNDHTKLKNAITKVQKKHDKLRY